MNNTWINHKNRISSTAGTNHWIPFTEIEVNSRERFESSFMTDFIKGKLGEENFVKENFNSPQNHNNGQMNLSPTNELFADHADFIPTSPLQFSPEAVAVFDAGRELWTYYHAQPNCNPNASLYDIREYFQGRNDAGKMNNKSTDEKYNLLIGNLRESLKTLGFKIQPKVYEYGFLRL